MRALGEVLRRNLQQALRRREYGEAHEILVKLKEADPLSLHTRGMELELLLASKALDEAESLATQLVRLFPDSARILLLAGQVAYRRREYTRALNWLEESNRIHPSAYTTRFLGKTLTELGQLEPAERTLLGVVDSHPVILRDLAWLYERKGDPERALAMLEDYLKKRPDDTLALSQRTRLRARSLDPATLVEEVESLLELGESPPDEMIVALIESLLALGKPDSARQILRERRDHVSATLATRLAWVCHKGGLPDMALELFLHTFERNCRNIKFLVALETDAIRCGRTEELLAIYAKRAPDDPRFYGRINRLERRRKR